MNVITKYAREGWKNEILCADYLVLIGENMENLRETFLQWKEIFF